MEDETKLAPKVVAALQKIPEERYLADRFLSKVIMELPPQSIKVLDVREMRKVVCMLDDIQAKFALLVTELQESLEKETSLKKVCSFVCHYLHNTYVPQHDPESFKQLLVSLQPHYYSLYYHILSIIVRLFVNKAMEGYMEEYRMTLEDWLESNTILEFKSTVANAVESVEADPTTGQCLVILKMHHGWLSVTMKNLQKLLTYLFGSSIFN